MNSRRKEREHQVAEFGIESSAEDRLLVGEQTLVRAREEEQSAIRGGIKGRASQVRQNTGS
jgi:hypothetical protein